MCAVECARRCSTTWAMERWTTLLVEAAGSPPTLREALEQAGATVLSAADVPEAITLLVESRVDAVVVQLELPRESGLSVLQHLREEGRSVPVMVLASRPDEQVTLQAFAQGCDDFLVAPFSPAEVIARLKRRLQTHRVMRALEDEAKRLHDLSVTDGLTQVSNHRAFQERVTEEFRRAQRYDDPLALILIDVDHFKAVNDQLGHQAGDEVLRNFAASVRLAIRETDFLARYGGEEFAVLLPKTHLAGALTVAERISQEVRRIKVGGDHGLRITASFGISAYPNRSVSTPEQLVRTSDEAMYRAKREGRNKIILFQPALKSVS